MKASLKLILFTILILTLQACEGEELLNNQNPDRLAQLERENQELKDQLEQDQIDEIFEEESSTDDKSNETEQIVVDENDENVSEQEDREVEEDDLADSDPSQRTSDELTTNESEQTSDYIQITNDKIRFYEPKKAKFSLNDDTFVLTGENNDQVAKIRIIWTNNSFPDLKDDYYLTQFKKGDKEWKYTMKPEYGNLRLGDNTYRIIAEDEEGNSLDTIFVYIKADYELSNVKLSLSGSLEVDWLDQPKAQDLSKLDQFFGTSCFDKDLLKSYEEEKRGLFLQGEVEKGKIYLIKQACEGPCFTDYIIRFIRTDEGENIILTKYSSEWTSNNIQQNCKDTKLDKETEIANLNPQKTIATSDQNQPLIYRNNWNEFIDPYRDNTVIYYSQKLTRKFYDTDKRCIVTANNDGTVAEYGVDFDFLEDTNENDKEYSGMPLKGKIDIVWDDGSNTQEYYSYESGGGCTGYSCYDVANENIELVKKGETVKGDHDVYLEKIDDFDSLNSENSDLYNLGTRDKKEDEIEELYKTKPIIYIKDPFNRDVKFTKEEFVPAVECGKPVIYLYPEKTQDIMVKVYPEGGFKITEPEYNEGWFVRSTPESEIHHYDTSTDWEYLFWEGYGINYQMPEKGFVVSFDNLEDFLIKKLAKLGLNQKETADFMEFWLPEMQNKNKPYYFVTFVDQEKFDQIAPLDITPKPDKIIRVFMDWKGLDEEIDVEPLEIKTPKREGFTVVEWGGAKH